MANPTTALTTAQSFEITPITEEVTAVIKDELDGLGPVPFDTVKVPSGGGIAFEVPGDNPEQPQAASELVGVIVYHHPINAYWITQFTGGNEQPDCASLDGKHGLEAATGELRSCKTCPYNEFGSAGDGSNGKACKNGHRIYLLRAGEVLPILLTLPPTSLKAFKEYLAKRVVLKGNRSWHVLTKITLKKEKNAGGIAYSSCVFTKVGDLDTAQIGSVLPTVDAVKQLAAAVPASADAQPQMADNDRFLDITADDSDLPFGDNVQ